MFFGRLKKAVRSGAISYQVPYLAALFCLFGFALAGLARDFEGGQRWLVQGLSSLMFLVAIAIVIKAVFISPELLRSERSILFEKIKASEGENTVRAAPEHLA